MSPERLYEHRIYRRIMAVGNIVAWCILAGVVIALAIGYDRLSGVVNDTHAGGCALRSDLRQRAAGTLAFVKSHPDGIAGVSAATLRTNARNQLRTARTLDRLHCGYTGADEQHHPISVQP